MSPTEIVLWLQGGLLVFAIWLFRFVKIEVLQEDSCKILKKEPDVSQ